MPGMTSSFLDKANESKRLALGAYSRQQPNQTTEPPGKTAGGLVSSAAGMGMAGYTMAGASAGGMTGPQGAAVGFGVGVLSYLLS